MSTAEKRREYVFRMKPEGDRRPRGDVGDSQILTLVHGEFWFAAGFGRAYILQPRKIATLALVRARVPFHEKLRVKFYVRTRRDERSARAIN